MNLWGSYADEIKELKDKVNSLEEDLEGHRMMLSASRRRCANLQRVIDTRKKRTSYHDQEHRILTLEAQQASIRHDVRGLHDEMADLWNRR